VSRLVLSIFVPPGMPMTSHLYVPPLSGLPDAGFPFLSIFASLRFSILDMCSLQNSLLAHLTTSSVLRFKHSMKRNIGNFVSGETKYKFKVQKKRCCHFAKLSAGYSASSLWPNYFILRATLELKERVQLDKYGALIRVLIRFKLPYQSFFMRSN